MIDKIAKIDKEKLAMEVEKHVYVYDKSHPNYKNGECIDQAWAQIASNLGIEGELIILPDLNEISVST